MSTDHLSYRICLMKPYVSWEFWLGSGNVTGLRWALVGKICIYSSVTDVACDWLRFRSCGDVFDMVPLVMLPHERSFCCWKCVWLCPSPSSMWQNPIKGLRGPKCRALKSWWHLCHPVSRMITMIASRKRWGMWVHSGCSQPWWRHSSNRSSVVLQPLN